MNFLFSVIAIDLHRTGDTETNEHLLLASSSDVIFQFNDVDVVEQVHDVIKSTPLECSETPVASESITRNPASYRVTCTYICDSHKYKYVRIRVHVACGLI